MESLPELEDHLTSFNDRVGKITDKVNSVFNMSLQVPPVVIDEDLVPRYYNASYSMFLKSTHSYVLSCLDLLISSLVKTNILAPTVAPIVFSWDLVDQYLTKVEDTISHY